MTNLSAVILQLYALYPSGSLTIIIKVSKTILILENVQQVIYIFLPDGTDGPLVKQSDLNTYAQDRQLGETTILCQGRTFFYQLFATSKLIPNIFIPNMFIYLVG